ncbi:hypothetical protein VitviT2T_009914 [Vitis vinifera]|uniref:ABC-type xenobiotic transporter n=2 Tax=Vitis vinifera TaxID=29760 RepID=A0ABY9C677_VITVI|nr:hypothetical protein VitviT2T_009914 [Vitis vinifera]
MFSDRGRFARQAALRSIMNTKMSKGTLVKEHMIKMIKMINLFNEMEILRVENNGETNIDMALDKSQLGDVIRQKEQKLDTPVLENGDNWSVGQRQLVSLGQALLKQATILVLDEATASVDTATDNLIQKIIRTEFQNCTVCTIAHRIPTVIDSDLVLVLSDGRVAEFDTPARLLEDKSSMFLTLVTKYSSSQIPGEAPPIIENSHPPSSWPENGTIELIDLKVRYKESLPVVLHSVTFKFPGGNKIGIVGRTGSGKSTLIQALFRMIEPAGGKIIIVNIDISTIGLHDIHSRLSIIPQDPTLLEGTIRGNLDPLEELSDQEIWQALDKSQLGDVIRQKEQKLDTPVLENGDNWSVGQRQLVSLGQALLKQATILVLDEATASIDTATDNLIQKIIRTEFQNCTVCTIAHRIPTIIDSDLALVLSDGQVASQILELDVVPQNLAVIKATRTYNYSKNTALLVVAAAAAAASASGKEMGD